MNFYFHIRKKDINDKDIPMKKHDLSLKKNLKRSKNKNACDIQQLALEHALAYFNKPWDQYLKDTSPQSSVPNYACCLHDGNQCSVIQKELNFNSCIVYKKFQQNSELTENFTVFNEEPSTTKMQEKDKRSTKNIKNDSSQSWRDLHGLNL